MSSARLWVYSGLAFVTGLPILLVGTPVLGDALNHVARMAVLAAPAASPLHRFYAASWTLTPYLAMDLVVWPLAHVMPVMLAARLFLIACLWMPVLGAASLQWAVHGRIGWVPACAFLFSANTLLNFGFLNYLVMTGPAVMLFALWLRAHAMPRWRRAGLFAIGATALYLGHIFAFAAYGLAIAGCEAARTIRAGFRPWRAVALDWAAAAAQAVPALLLFSRFDTGRLIIGPIQATLYGDLAARVTALASPVLMFADPVGALVVLASVALLALLAPRLALSPLVWPSLLVLGLASLAIPHELRGIWGTDLRFPLVAAMLLAGGARPRLGRRAGAAAIACIAVLTMVKSADTLRVLHRLDARAGQLRRVLASLPAGARLLVMDEPDLGTATPEVPANALWHLPMLAVIERQAFVPTLFTGFMTVRPREAMLPAATPSGQPVTPAQLADDRLRRDVPGVLVPDGRGGRAYWLGWPGKFDFLLVQHDARRSALPPGLEPVAQSEVADLYRIAAVR